MPRKKKVQPVIQDQLQLPVEELEQAESTSISQDKLDKLAQETLYAVEDFKNTPVADGWVYTMETLNSPFQVVRRLVRATIQKEEDYVWFASCSCDPSMNVSEVKDYIYGKNPLDFLYGIYTECKNPEDLVAKVRSGTLGRISSVAGDILSFTLAMVEYVPNEGPKDLALSCNIVIAAKNGIAKLTVTSMRSELEGKKYGTAQ